MAGHRRYDEDDEDERPGVRRAREEAEARRLDLKQRMAAYRGEIPNAGNVVRTVEVPGRANRTLDINLVRQLAMQAAAGLPVEAGAARCRVPVSLLRGWLARGLVDLDAGDETMEAELVLAVGKASADHQAGLVKTIEDSTADRGINYGGAAWLLEQGHPATWGKKVQTVDLTVSHVVVEGVAGLSAEQRAQLRGQAQRVIEAQEPRRIVGPEAGAK